MSNPPDFSCRDPLQATFWDQRFAQGFTPWDKGGLPEQIRTFVQQQAPMHSLIPGCGNAHEVALFAAQNWPVVALDFAASAVQSAQHSLQEIDPSGKLAEMVVQADFFNYQPSFALECIYERAFLCAMPPARWPDLAKRWAQLLPPGGLLVGYFFIDEDAANKPKGPPFCISQENLNALLEEHFICQQDAAVNDSLAVFAGKERWQIWQRRAD